MNVVAIANYETQQRSRQRRLRPRATVAPAISGTPADGETLTASSGTWKGRLTDTLTYAYQWTKDGVAIAGETSNTYVVVTGDVGSLIGCEVTATQETGSPAYLSTMAPATPVEIE